ncbi:methyltransferase domain-containing protein [Streptomyces oryzae]|uniref:Protein-L-isoaspartate O-methyltransferase n=1 Tax=Streptomyces oryzae TaxID=1434886 RepID=A0ABS3XLM2_9ACTN|nr:methyltransferase domain-containing protein [Streptomyces oryzae]MBO8196304.1 methyltransferase domain-containing protein [Streptomyces oryzae]
MTGTQRNRALLDHLQHAGHLAGLWRPAFEAMPRHRFIPDQVWRHGERTPVDREADADSWWELVYRDEPVITQRAPDGTPTSSSSKPSMVAAMLGHLDPQPGDAVLEIGTGTGWNAALLTHRAGPGRVTTLEVDPAVARSAEQSLRQTDQSVRVVCADGERGWPGAAPYQRIVLTCSVRAVPAALLAQSAPGAVIVAPIWGAGLARLTSEGNGTAQGRFVAGADFMPSRALGAAVVRPTGPSWKSPTELDPRCVADLGFQAYVHMRMPGVRLAGEQKDGTYQAWVEDGHGSAAHADGTGAVWEWGERALWEELEKAHTDWERANRPGPEQYRVTAGPDGQRIDLAR